MHTRRIKISQESAYRAGVRQSIAENKLIVCRATGRPLIFPNVIEGVCALLENPEKKEKYRTTEKKGGGAGIEWRKRMRMNVAEERIKKTKKTSTMQLQAGGRRGRTSGRRVPGVFYWLVSVGWKFRIMYEMFAWTLLTLSPATGLSRASLSRSVVYIKLIESMYSNEKILQVFLPELLASSLESYIAIPTSMHFYIFLFQIYIYTYCIYNFIQSPPL